MAESETCARVSTSLPLNILKQIDDDASTFASHFHFDREECNRLLMMYELMVATHGKMDRERFRHFLFKMFNIMDNIVLDLMFRAFDTERDGQISKEEFLRGLSVLFRGTNDEIIKFCWAVYDMNGDGSLARDEVLGCITGCFVRGFMPQEECDEAENELVELFMKKLDVNRDGLITFDDFQIAARNEPLLSQALGQCIPSARAMSGFLGFVTEDNRSYNQYVSQSDGSSRLNRGRSLYGSMIGKSLSDYLKNAGKKPQVKASSSKSSILRGGMKSQRHFNP